MQPESPKLLEDVRVAAEYILRWCASEMGRSWRAYRPGRTTSPAGLPVFRRGDRAVKEPKAFDCVGFKRQAQARIYETIKDLSSEEEIAYFRKAAEEGPLGPWWKKLSAAGRADEPRRTDG